MPSEGRDHYPATARLKKRADFQRVYREGVRETGRHLVVFLMRADDEHWRFGVTASRKVGGAVVRSRCKRRLRELYRTHRGILGDVAADVVINARRSCALAPWSDLERDYLDCMGRGFVALERRLTRNHTTRPG